MTDRVENMLKLAAYCWIPFAAALLCGTPVQAASIADARAALRRLGDAVQARDAGTISRLYGDRYQTRDTRRILWDALERNVRHADAILSQPVRTLTAPEGIVIIGWDDDTLRAVVFRRSGGVWFLSAQYLDITAGTPRVRTALQEYLLQAPAEALRDSILVGYGEQLARELKRLTRSATPARPAVAAPADPLAALVARYEAVWYQGSCSAMSEVYDARVVFRDSFGDEHHMDGLRQVCKAAKRSSCRIVVRQLTTSASMVIVTAEEVCTAGGGMASSMPKTFEVTVTDDRYRILRERGGAH